jgi:hypothetical protein
MNSFKLNAIFVSIALAVNAFSQESITGVKKMWVDRAKKAVTEAMNLVEELEKIKSSEREGKLRLLIAREMAYALFLDPKTRDLVMKTDNNFLYCHLLIKSSFDDSGTDLVYIYDKSGTLISLRIDKIAKGHGIVVVQNILNSSVLSGFSPGEYIFISFADRGNIPISKYAPLESLPPPWMNP